MEKTRRGKEEIDPAPRLLMVLLRYDLGWFERRQLAEALGIAPSLVSMWERGERRIPREAMDKAADQRGLPRQLLAPALRAHRSFRLAAQGKSRSRHTVDLVVAFDLLPLLLETTDLVLAPLRREKATAEDPEEVEALWARLARRTPAERRLLVEEGEEYRTQALRERVEAESAAVAMEQPRLARELAELAGWMERAGR
jgi:transcriptional regulator with XRE-family HTH domain